MKNMKRVMIMFTLLAVSGCTRSLSVPYKAGVDYTPASQKISDTSISIKKFTDERAWISEEDSKSPSFIAQQGPWRFGITYEDQEYAPVAVVLQKLFIKEFNNAGYHATTFSGATTNEDYLLAGKIINFEFENEAGLVTVTSRQHVTLALTLTGKNGKNVFSNELFSDLDRDNEGMIVTHSTNLDKLFNGTLKDVVVKVLQTMELRLAASDVVLHVSVNGIELPGEWLNNAYALKN